MSSENKVSSTPPPEKVISDPNELPEESTAVAIIPDKSVDDAVVELTTSQHAFAFTVFIMIGTAQLLPWNGLLNTMFAVLATIFPDVPAISSSVTATYSTVIMLCTLFFIIRPGVNLYVTYAGLILTSIVALVYGLTAHASSAAVSPLLHTIAGLMALAAALIGSSAFAYAARFPRNYCGALSAGLGMSGVVTFVLWMVSKYGIFSSTVGGTQGANWVVNGFVIILSALAAFLVYILFQRPWARCIFALKAENDTEKEQRDVQGTYEEGGLVLIMKNVWWFALLYCLHMTITLYCFPTIGPAAWADKQWEADVLVGVFQLGDLVGRYLPNLLPFLICKRNTCAMYIVVRLVFVLTFTLTFALRQSTAFFGYFGIHFIQMLLLALTNGWLCTACFIRMPEMVEGDAARARVASISLLSTFVGIFLGQWIAYGVTV